MKEIIEKELSILDGAIIYALEHSKPIDLAGADLPFSTNNDQDAYDNSPVNTNDYLTLKASQNIVKINDNQLQAYEEFLRAAWGKAIRINSEFKGEMIYRLSQSAAVIPYANMAMPASPIGRIVSIARAGDKFESSYLGKYTIEDVWYFERYNGSNFVRNIKNFKKISSNGENNFTVCDLKKWLEDFNSEISIEIVTDDGDPNDWSELLFDDDLSDYEIFEDDDLNKNEQPEELNDSISLSTRFYVNLTANQYDAAHSGANGLVFVSGVAGSGKTSVALGRAKSLFQLSQLPSTEEMHNIDFLQETQIGIVRTSELINYLKDTCNMLSLHTLPVVEYRDILEELKHRWDIDLSFRSKDNKPKFKLANSACSESSEETTREWFDLISQVMINTYIDNCISCLQNSKLNNISKFDGNFLTKVFAVIEKQLLKIPDSKKTPIGLLNQISNIINKSINDIFNEFMWVGLTAKDQIKWYSTKIDDVVVALKSNNKILCHYNDSGSFDLIIPKNDVNNWIKWLPKEHSGDYSNNHMPEFISVSNSKGESLRMKIRIADDSTILKYIRYGVLRYYIGIGEKNLFIRTSKILVVDMKKASLKFNQFRDTNSDKNIKKWRSKIRSRAISHIKNCLCKLTPYSLYKKSLKDIKNNKFDSVISKKNKKLHVDRVNNNDIDFLLGFMISITRELDINKSLIYGANKLIPPPYRSSVFIDEVQDFTEIQTYLLSLLSDPKYNSVTAVGDSAQCLYSSISNISKSFPLKMWDIAKQLKLETNIRQQDSPTLSALSETFRSQFIDDVPIMKNSYKRNHGLRLHQEADSSSQINLAYDAVIDIPKHETVVIVVPSSVDANNVVNKIKDRLWENQHKECNYSSTLDLSKKYVIHITTPKNVKGLEFDNLIALYIDKYDISDQEGKNSIYVLLTRPLKKLVIIGNISSMSSKFKKMLDQFADKM